MESVTAADHRVGRGGPQHHEPQRHPRLHRAEQQRLRGRADRPHRRQVAQIINGLLDIKHYYLLHNFWSAFA